MHGRRSDAGSNQQAPDPEPTEETAPAPELGQGLLAMLAAVIGLVMLALAAFWIIGTQTHSVAPATAAAGIH